MLRGLIFILLAFSLVSCGASRSKVVTTKKEASKNSVAPVNAKASNIISYARTFEGTRYKYGGSTKRGMDCSGLIYVSFLEEDIPMPRTSRDLSKKGDRLYLKEVSPGDLLFFETDKNRKVINHVGLVVEVRDKNIYFIHSSTSRGVIISSLSENYWNNNFVMARRVL